MHANPEVIEINDRSTSGPPRFATSDDGLSAFLCARPRLFGVAYRMLGSAAAAEDIVQDVWVRWQMTERGAVRAPAAFLITAATRLAINVIQSARARHETSSDPELPEPVDTSTDPAGTTERKQALNRAVRLLLERLSPVERAAYVLREAFNYPYREIAGVLRVEEANARQLVTRAREHVAGQRRSPVSPIEQRTLLHAIAAAAETGDLSKLESLFAPGLPVVGTAARSVTSQRVTRSSRYALRNAESDSNTEGTHHETRHHRRHRADRIEARRQTP